VITDPGKRTLLVETDYKVEELEALADHCYDIQDIGASIASGSFKTEGMVVAPCSVKTLSAIAHSYTDNLLVRACDVVLKERRKLVLLFRETPLHLGHLRNLERVAEMGGILLPPVPAFYHRPKTLLDVVNQTVGKVLDLLGIDHRLFLRWGPPPAVDPRSGGRGRKSEDPS
ncbi:MAG: UbiX family flavin prenyltransferase, partial [Candidatus Tectomicrobia bacterium]|nr:UbiX family flavin prenyltransferase [Candidatus Tectomicrobia bacterium]